MNERPTFPPHERNPRMTRYDYVDLACILLRGARRSLARANAPKALAKVRRALKSAEGARRHAQNDQWRLQRQRKKAVRP